MYSIWRNQDTESWVWRFARQPKLINSTDTACHPSCSLTQLIYALCSWCLKQISILRFLSLNAMPVMFDGTALWSISYLRKQWIAFRSYLILLRTHFRSLNFTRTNLRPHKTQSTSNGDFVVLVALVQLNILGIDHFVFLIFDTSWALISALQQDIPLTSKCVLHNIGPYGSWCVIIF